MRSATRTLLAICLAALVLRIALATYAPGPAWSAYENIEQAQHIAKTGLPLFTQTEYGKYYPLPIFPYILAFSTLFMPDSVAYMLIPNVLAVLAHAAIYLLLMELTGKEHVALLGALASVFVPAYLSATLLTVSSVSLAIPLLLYTVALYFKLRKTKEKRLQLLGIFILASLTHQLTLLIIPFLVIGLILTAVRDAKGEIAQQEFAIFALFYLIWLYILLYKRFIASYGIEIFVLHAPAALSQAAVSLSAQWLAINIGVVVFGLALYATYKETAGDHIGIQAVLALCFSIIFGLVIAPTQRASLLAMFGLVCVVLATIGLHHLLRYVLAFRRTFSVKLLSGVVALLFVLTSVIPTVLAGVQAAQTSVPREAAQAAAWINENTPKDSLLLPLPDQAFYYRVQSNRPVYLTDNYLLTANAEEKYQRTIAVHNQSERTLREMAEVEYVIGVQPWTIPCVNTVYNQSVYIAKVLC